MYLDDPSLVPKHQRELVHVTLTNAIFIRCRATTANHLITPNWIAL